MTISVSMHGLDLSFMQDKPKSNKAKIKKAAKKKGKKK